MTTVDKMRELKKNLENNERSLEAILGGFVVNKSDTKKIQSYIEVARAYRIALQNTLDIIDSSSDLTADEIKKVASIDEFSKMCDEVINAYEID